MGSSYGANTEAPHGRDTAMPIAMQERPMGAMPRRPERRADDQGQSQPKMPAVTRP